jgi:DNA repair photolyase
MSIPDERAARKGRGATFNPEGRFETQTRTAVDDGWGSLDEPLPPIETIIRPEPARTIITRNDSPDISFGQSINPYRGCEHGCIYCLSGDTGILMADGSVRALAEIRVGDEIYGTQRQGWYRRYVRSRVLAHWRVIKPAYRITLEDGTSLTAGPDHRFLTERGWKFVTGAECGAARRPHLTVVNKLMGVGAFAEPIAKNEDYRQGYLSGMIRGDGHLGEYRYPRAGRANGDQYRFRLALCDTEALARAQAYLYGYAISTQEFAFCQASSGRRAMRAIRTSARQSVQNVRNIIAWPGEPSREWCAGFLAGIFDAEGSYSQGILRISNTDEGIVARIHLSLRMLRFTFTLARIERPPSRTIQVVRLLGGLREHLRFFHSVDPAITRKRDIAGQAVKSEARLRIASIEALGKALPLYDLTTETEDFIANGVVSHNCYARPAHAYVNLSPGLDFETKIFYKENAAALLEKELRKPGYQCQSIALGTNTDPYQPAERTFKVTRSLLEVMQRFRQPFSIVTKGAALMERDLDIMSEMGRAKLAMVALSITSLKDEIKRTLEPRTSSPASRLRMISKLREAGVPVMVMVAPVIPFITDSEMESILEKSRDAGALAAGYVMLRLPWEVKDLFQQWLETHFPLKAQHVMSLVRQIRGGEAQRTQAETVTDPDDINQEVMPDAITVQPSPYRKNPYYSAQWGVRQRGVGEFANLIEKRFKLACKRLELNRWHSLRLDTGQFHAPPAAGDQLALSL